MALSRTLYVVFLVVALIKKEALGSSDAADQRIINGTVVPFGNAPFQVSFQYERRHFCGGSIIDPYFIVTAAHCCDLVRSDSVRIRAGLNHLSNPEDGFQEITVAGLKESLILSSERRTAMIKLSPAGYTASGMANVTGWGQSQSLRTDALMRATVTIVPDNICRQKYPTIFVDEMICAGEDNKGTCYGDSGGPLVDSEGYLVGIASFAPGGCVVAGYPGGYAEVSYFTQWIRATLANSTRE